jgi:Bax protein
MAKTFRPWARGIFLSLAVGGVLWAVAAGWRLAHELYATHGAGYVLASGLRIGDAADIAGKKAAFFAYLWPVVEAENRRITNLRRRLVAARQRQPSPPWVGAVAANHGLDWTGRDWDELLKRVDITPLPLVLAQSANETNWGQSRFARQGNNMFGQWCFRTGCGLVPKRRASGKQHEVAAFETVNASVRSYLNNINSNRAYAMLRDLRQQARRRGENPKADDLAAGLEPYSQRGMAYVNDIRAMIRVNRALISMQPVTSR